MSDRLAAALDYARAGLRVIPVSRAKKPYFTGWKQAATSDSAQIEAWWAQYPNANIVTFTGHEAGFFVLDVDRRHGGDVSLAALEREHGTLLPTLTTQTGDGFHYYFKTPGFPVRSMDLAPGVEVKGEKGAVTLPPSVHASGHVYRWIGTVRDIAAAPAWLFDRVRPVARHVVATPPRVCAAGTARYAQRALESEADSVRRASDGTRNNTLNAASFSLGQLVGAGLLTHEDVTGVLLDAAIASGLSEAEAHATIASGLRAGIAKPRVLSSRAGR